MNKDLQCTEDKIKIADAQFPKPFRNGLEFNAPVHGTWNIVHIGMTLPEAVQVYVCAKNCMRGVVLTAAEMNAQDRFSFVILDENDMVRESIDEATIEGVTDVLQKRDKLPRAVLLFTVCVHHFLGSDYKKIYSELEKRFPEVDFYRCYMDPVMQKKGFTPDQKLRRAMYEKLPACEPKKNVCAILGGDFAIDPSADFVQYLTGHGIEVRQFRKMTSYDEFLRLSEAEVFVVTHPAGKMGVEQAAKRLGRKFLYLPASFDPEEIHAQIKELGEAFGFIEDSKEAETADLMPEYESSAELQNKANTRADQLHELIGNTPIVIDYTVHPRPLGLAQFLLMHGMNVQTVYLDAVSGEEEKAFQWLQKNEPELMLSSTIHVEKRHKEGMPNGNSENESAGKILAFGQKAAYFCDTSYFVNVMFGFGMHGWDGVYKLMELAEEAFLHEKDTRDIVPRKGLGCDSCF